MKPKLMTNKQKEAFESTIEKAVNSDLKWMLKTIKHELKLSNSCIKDGDENPL